MNREQREFTGIRFRRGKNPTQRESFVGYVRNINPTERDILIVGDVERGGIAQEGKYDVVCVPMREGKGWIVVSSTPVFDSVSVGVSYTEKTVGLLLNGKQAYLFKWNEEKKRTQRTILLWDMKNRYLSNARIFLRNVEIKLGNVCFSSTEEAQREKVRILEELGGEICAIRTEEAQRHYSATQKPFEHLKKN